MTNDGGGEMTFDGHPQVEETVRRLAVEVQAAVESRNPHEAEQYASALRDTCAGLRDLVEMGREPE